MSVADPEGVQGVFLINGHCSKDIVTRIAYTYYHGK